MATYDKNCEMEEIIEYTNSENFKSFGNLEMQKLNYNAINSFAEIYIQTELNETIKHWKITAKHPIRIGFFESYNFLNYREISLIDEHALLNSICDNYISCSLEGKPENRFTFIGELCYEMEKITGNWISVNEVITSFKTLFEKENYPHPFSKFVENKNDETLSLPEFLFETIKNICEKHSILIKEIDKINNAFNYQNQMLIFGNEIVTGKNNLFLNQPHVIAQEFLLE
ncbi:hypothetical protein EG349_18805 [Chryseobacterium shandongense]|uniref:Uncharacterized protein n=2 Tax=Chryseobacterium shandongense TaxID=1493872 RepID=A0AAD0YIZ3_9FLAO|nr:hypothetical protein EG349_18805 [Chryseobacterium shandongense]AZA97214.1 hypothetical protein EG353_17515 [Chryseobacterium shandongense]